MDNENKFASLDSFKNESRESRRLESDEAVYEMVKVEGVSALTRLIDAIKKGHIKGLMVTTILSDEAKEHMDSCGFGFAVVNMGDMDHLAQHVFMNAYDAVKKIGGEGLLGMLTMMVIKEMRESGSSEDEACGHQKH